MSDGTVNCTSQTPTWSGDICAEISGTPRPAIPTTTVPWGAVIEPGAATELVPTTGIDDPRPVTSAVRFSPRRAGLVGVTNEPSGRMTTARVTPSRVWV